MLKALRNPARLLAALFVGSCLTVAPGCGDDAEVEVDTDPEPVEVDVDD